jgi:hypothetical protein
MANSNKPRNRPRGIEKMSGRHDAPSQTNTQKRPIPVFHHVLELNAMRGLKGDGENAEKNDSRQKKKNGSESPRVSRPSSIVMSFPKNNIHSLPTNSSKRAST